MTDPKSDPKLGPGTLMRGQKTEYVVAKRLAGGAFGELWVGKRVGDKSTKFSNLAFKMEPFNSPMPQVPLEYVFYKKLGKNKCVPAVYDLITHKEKYWVLVMDRLGKSIADRRDWCRVKMPNGRMPLKDALNIAVQLIDLFEYIHSRRVIHRDVKPENFLFGLIGKTLNQLHVIDLGLAKEYVDESGKHCEFQAGQMKMGTARYMSINAHLGFALSRRDDLESVAYVLLSLVKDKLPWDDVRETDKLKRNDSIKQVKQRTPIFELKNPEGIPDCFTDFLEDVRPNRLHFDVKPDYRKYRRMFESYAKSQKLALDNNFAWSNEKVEL